MKRIVSLAVALWLLTGSASPALSDEQDLVRQMQDGNAVLMIRHALAPGVGDPEEFVLDDCSTQRNLNQAGRDQARAIGQWLRSRGIREVKLYSSQWCRCLETARLMKIGTVTPLAALNSFFQRPESRHAQLSALREFIAENTKPGELIIMVTHQVTITAITGQWVESGHGKLLRPAKSGGVELVGELSFLAGQQ